MKRSRNGLASREPLDVATNREEMSDGAVLIADGPFAGWMTWPDTDPFETLVGPYYFRPLADGGYECATVLQTHHHNGHGVAHGGALMTFADFALFALSRDHLRGEPAVTASFNGEFIGPAKAGDTVICRGEVLRAGKSLVFTRGLLSVAGEPVFAFSGVIKRLPPRRTA